ncbi:hypothetical protein [Mesorhizobium sp. M0199]|uniref:hypothetical protein n=1 Tax=Mesorhizobium sp. M0199 TaxID=2956911 RepID=UPI0033392E2B
MTGGLYAHFRNTGSMIPSTLQAPDFPANVRELDDEALLDIVQRQTARYFWEGAHPVSGLARDRQKTTGAPANDLAAIGGSGFGIMAIIVAVERGWIDSTAALCRLQRMLDFLESSPRYHGVFPHFINGRTGATIPFRRKDDGADLVETTFLFQGLICAREYFAGMATEKARLRHSVNALLSQVRTRGPATDVALEPEPRLGDGQPDQRLE